MIVDTSVWVDHLRRHNRRLGELLVGGLVEMHPFILGELACGNLHERPTLLGLLGGLPSAVIADHDEALALLERRRLHGRGIGWVDVHLLTSAMLTRVPLWTLDRRLAAVTAELGVDGGVVG
ncbi:MAG: type II toxin-antitoxin system VapC family toxin [Acidimicrobiia bacterium]|nr:type II toxin-antitoxin system VapC family toxin [Acidimicrobiia bacterium]